MDPNPNPNPNPDTPNSRTPPRSFPTRITRTPSTSSAPLPPAPLKSILKRSATIGSSQPHQGSQQRENTESDGPTSNSETNAQPVRRVRFADEVATEIDSPEERARKRDKLKAWGKSFVKKFNFRKRDEDDDKPGPYDNREGMRRRPTIRGGAV